jgi:beta-galactosidase
LALDGAVFGGAAEGQVWAEYLRVEDADTLATFSDGALSGWPAVTRRATTGGAGWYVATLPEPAALERLAAQVVQDAGIERPTPVTRGGQVESVRRGGALFVINHGADDAELLISGTDALTGAPTSGMRLPPHGVAIVRTMAG